MFRELILLVLFLALITFSSGPAYSQKNETVIYENNSQPSILNREESVLQFDRDPGADYAKELPNAEWDVLEISQPEYYPIPDLDEDPNSLPLDE